MGSHLLHRLEECLQLTPGRGQRLAWLCLSSKGRELDPSKEGQADKKQVKEAVEEGRK